MVNQIYQNGKKEGLASEFYSFLPIYHLRKIIIQVKMKNFEVSLNGTKICQAGIDAEFGVLTAHVTWVKRIGATKETVDLDVSGLNSETENHIRWVGRPLSVNDEITIRVTESVRPDPPYSVKHKDLIEKEYRARQLEIFYRLREELKDLITD